MLWGRSVVLIVTHNYRLHCNSRRAPTTMRLLFAEVLLKVHKRKYGQIHLIASLIDRLSRYHHECAVAVVDEVLEEFRLLEINQYGMQQCLIAHMRLLGEQYNCEHVDSSVVFDTLYLIMVFGHVTEEQDVLDPPAFELG